MNRLNPPPEGHGANPLPLVQNSDGRTARTTASNEIKSATADHPANHSTRSLVSLSPIASVGAVIDRLVVSVEEHATRIDAPTLQTVPKTAAAQREKKRKGEETVSLN